MAFIVEDGTGLANANSYTSVEFADAYFGDRGNDDWVALNQQRKEQALVNATDFIDVRFHNRFRGRAQFDSQALKFPRVGVPCSPPGAIPMFLQKATAEYAARSAVNELAPDPTIDPSGRAVIASRKKVGPIEKELKFSDGGAHAILLFKPYPMADALLTCSLYPAQGMVIRN